MTIKEKKRKFIYEQIQYWKERWNDLLFEEKEKLTKLIVKLKTEKNLNNEEKEKLLTEIFRLERYTDWDQ